jgi:hypothetical protein
MFLHGQEAKHCSMKDDPIPINNHVSRYVSGSKITRSGRITGAAFELRPKENALSVNWLEYLGLEDRNLEIQEIRKVFVAKGWNLRPEARFTVLNVGETKAHVRQESDDNRVLPILHHPSLKDDSHSRIYNVPRDDPAIGDMIAELIEDEAIYPAREPMD